MIDVKKALSILVSLVFVVCFLGQGSAEAQSQITWEKVFNIDSTYGGAATSVKQTRDGGYIIAGLSNPWEYLSKVLVWKLDVNGSIQWQKQYEYDVSPSYLSEVGIQETADGGYIVLSSTCRGLIANDNDVVVFKLDVNGNIQWQNAYTGTIEFTSTLSREVVWQTKDGGYVVEGMGDNYPWILKLDSNGAIVWRKTYLAPSFYVASFQPTTDNGYIMTGTTTDFWKTYVMKLDETGNIQWKKEYNGFEVWDEATIRQTSDSGYILVGSGIMKLNANGSIQWQKAYDGLYEIFSIAQTTDNGYVVTANGGLYGGLPWVAKIDPEGNIVWQKIHEEGGNWSALFSVEQTTDGGYITAGISASNLPWVVKLDAMGNSSDCSSKIQDDNTLAIDTNVNVIDTAPFEVIDDVIQPQATYAVVADATLTSLNMCSSPDTTPPVLTLSATPTTLWPPNHKMVDVQINGSATDAGSGVASVVITVSDEYGKYNMTVPGFGSTIQLEAWRDGDDMDGRTYTITAVATDKAGNQATATTEVLVPHDMGK